MEYKDFPKNNKNEFVSLINCSSQPPLISHGIGKDVESCHDMVRLAHNHTEGALVFRPGSCSLGHTVAKTIWSPKRRSGLRHCIAKKTSILDMFTKFLPVTHVPPEHDPDALNQTYTGTSNREMMI